MKGIVGMVKCDQEGCPNMFMDDSGLRTGHTDSAQAANDAERKAVEDGWSRDARGKIRHYCPGHTAERRHMEQLREKAFETKPGNPDRPEDPKPEHPVHPEHPEKPDKPDRK